MNSYRYDRWLIILHFCYLFIVDCLLIYGSMWIVMVYVGLGEKEGVGYNLGMYLGYCRYEGRSYTVADIYIFLKNQHNKMANTQQHPHIRPKTANLPNPANIPMLHPALQLLQPQPNLPPLMPDRHNG